MKEEIVIAHLEKLRTDIRGEIKQRIKQRDRFSYQLVLALGALVAVSFSEYGTPKVLIAAPLVTIYYTALILYSYKIHSAAAGYLRTVLEPQLAKLHGLSTDVEWETYYKQLFVPGIRHTFFLWMLWTVSVGTLLYLWLTEREATAFKVALYGLTPLYLFLTSLVSVLDKPLILLYGLLLADKLLGRYKELFYLSIAAVLIAVHEIHAKASQQNDYERLAS